MTTCTARIKPFGDTIILTCEEEGEDHLDHSSVLRDYAHPGSETRIHWFEDDRRNFRGDWMECPNTAGCVLPAGHPRKCAL